MQINLFNILVCPLCQGKLCYDPMQKELICRPDRLAFPVKDDIPVLLSSEARTLSLEEYEKSR